MKNLIGSYFHLIDSEKEISWTSEELHEWKKAKLIPEELFSVDNEKNLIIFLQEMMPHLKSHYQSSLSEELYKIIVPPPSEWSNATELKVVNSKTGEVVNILEQMKSFELCEGVSLKIKAKELPDWEKETCKARKLNKKQNSILKEILDKLGPDRPLTRKEIVTLIEEVSKSNKSQKVRHAGHFTDCKLQYDYPLDTQPSLFDILSPRTKEKIESSEMEVKTIGIKLNPAEDKLINAIYKLLHDKSENKDENSELFYSGNEPSQIVPYGNYELEAKSSFLRIQPSELYREYYGNDLYSGKDISNIKSILQRLSTKKFIIRYYRKRKVNCGSKIENRTDRIEEYQNLLNIISYIEGLTDIELKNLEKGDTAIEEKKGELIIALNPVLTDQINSKYIEYPTDINQRTIIASGGRLHVTESIISLRDYMLREISNKRYKCEINVEKLPYILRLDNYIKSSRKKLINERINGALIAVKNLGIILNYEISEGTLGQQKYLFYLNENFE